MRDMVRRKGKAEILLLALALVAALVKIAIAHAEYATSSYIVKRAVVVYIDGVITRVTADYIEHAVSQLSPGDILIIILNTPGGSLDAALDITKILENLDKPVIAFVYPRGAYAWSAGTLILMAAHIAAMAPGTVIGSCQPVAINILTGTAYPVNESKIINAIIGYFSEAAKLTGKNETFVKLCVLKNMNLGPKQALRYHVINVIATDIRDLLLKVNGTEDPLLKKRLIVKSHVEIVKVEPGLLYRIRQYLTDPLVLQTLFFIGFLVLMIGGLAGAAPLAAIGIALIVVTLTLTLLPLNAAGILMLIIGSILVLAELLSHFASHGAMFSAGALLSAMGILLGLQQITPPHMLLRTYVSALTALGYSSLAAAVVFSVIVALLIYRAYRRRPYSETMLDLTGRRGIAVEDIGRDQVGYVKIGGEYWRARALEDIHRGDEIIVVSMRDGELLVKRAPRGKTSS